MEKFTFFWSGPFSNWHPSPFEYKGEWFNCSEQFYMAAKARFFKDENSRNRIMSAVMPSDQKRYGRQVENFDEKEWHDVAKDIMLIGCLCKFSQNLNLKNILMATEGTTLVEASPEDCIWGIGLRKNDPKALNRSTWRGLNWLGEVLTQIREQFKKQ